MRLGAHRHDRVTGFNREAYPLLGTQLASHATHQEHIDAALGLRPSTLSQPFIQHKSFIHVAALIYSFTATSCFAAVVEAL